jgi:hypothetical protein
VNEDAVVEEEEGVAEGVDGVVVVELSEGVEEGLKKGC